MPGASDPDRVHRIVAATSNKDPLSDDFSLVQVTFA
jgi:hypothetical protein